MNIFRALQKSFCGRPWSGCLSVGVLVLFLFAGEGRAQTAPREYQLKAAFLYNFSKFVEWPAESFSSTNSPIVIGIFGQNPFANELEKIVQGRKLNGRSFEVRVVHSAAEVRTTHILFVRGSEEKKFAQVSADLKKANVLTVGESEQFCHTGGVINLVLVQDKIHFDINMVAADKAQLKISSQLQKLANNKKK